jgi:hypothetical protein
MNHVDEQIRETLGEKVWPWELTAERHPFSHKVEEAARQLEDDILEAYREIHHADDEAWRHGYTAAESDRLGVSLVDIGAGVYKREYASADILPEEHEKMRRILSIIEFSLSGGTTTKVFPVQRRGRAWIVREEPYHQEYVYTLTYFSDTYSVNIIVSPRDFAVEGEAPAFDHTTMALDILIAAIRYL